MLNRTNLVRAIAQLLSESDVLKFYALVGSLSEARLRSMLSEATQQFIASGPVRLQSIVEPSRSAVGVGR